MFNYAKKRTLGDPRPRECDKYGALRTRRSEVVLSARDGLNDRNRLIGWKRRLKGI